MKVMRQVRYVVGMAATAISRFKKGPLLKSDDGTRFVPASYFCDLNDFRGNSYMVNVNARL